MVEQQRAALQRMALDRLAAPAAAAPFPATSATSTAPPGEADVSFCVMALSLLGTVPRRVLFGRGIGGGSHAVIVPHVFC